MKSHRFKVHASKKMAAGCKTVNGYYDGASIGDACSSASTLQ